MKKFLAILSAVILVGAAVPVRGAPIIDHYESASLDNDFQDGRFSLGLDAWPAPTDGEIAAASWDGVTLGSEWTLTGATVAAPITITPIFPGLTQYDIVYDPGASLTLKQGAAWDGGDGVDYTVSLDSLEETLFVWTDPLGNITNTVANLTFEGSFSGFGGVYELVDGTASGVFRGFGVTAPADYPVKPGAFPIAGWGVLNNIQFDITPEPATLALVGLGFGGLLLRRRRR